MGRVHPRQALAALRFLEHVSEQPLNRIQGVIRACKPKRLSVVLTSDEVEAVLAHLRPTWIAYQAFVWPHARKRREQIQ